MLATVSAATYHHSLGADTPPYKPAAVPRRGYCVQVVPVMPEEKMQACLCYPDGMGCTTPAPPLAATAYQPTEPSPPPPAATSCSYCPPAEYSFSPAAPSHISLPYSSSNLPSTPSWQAPAWQDSPSQPHGQGSYHEPLAAAPATSVPRYNSCHVARPVQQPYDFPPPPMPALLQPSHYTPPPPQPQPAPPAPAPISHEYSKPRAQEEPNFRLTAPPQPAQRHGTVSGTREAVGGGGLAEALLDALSDNSSSGSSTVGYADIHRRRRAREAAGLSGGNKHEVEMLQERVVEQQEEILRLQARVSELDPVLRVRAAKEQKKLHKELDKANKRLAALRQEMELIQSEADQLSADNKGLREAAERAAAREKAALLLERKAKSTVQREADARRAAQKEAERYRTVAEGVKADVENLQGEACKLLNRKVDKDREVFRLRRQVALLQGQLSAAKEKVEFSSGDMESLEARMQALRDRNTSLEKQLKHIQEMTGGSKERDAFLARLLEADASELQQECALMAADNARLAELLEAERAAHTKEREARRKIEEEKGLLEEEAQLMATMICGPSAEDEYVQNSREWRALAEELQQSLSKEASAAAPVLQAASVPTTPGSEDPADGSGTPASGSPPPASPPLSPVGQPIAGGSLPSPPFVAPQQQQQQQAPAWAPLSRHLSSSSIATENSVDLGSVVVRSNSRDNEVAESVAEAAAADSRRRLGQLAARGGSAGARSSPKPPAHHRPAAPSLRCADLVEVQEIEVSSLSSSPDLSPVGQASHGSLPPPQAAAHERPNKPLLAGPCSHSLPASQLPKPKLQRSSTDSSWTAEAQQQLAARRGQSAPSPLELTRALSLSALPTRMDSTASSAGWETDGGPSSSSVAIKRSASFKRCEALAEYILRRQSRSLGNTPRRSWRGPGSLPATPPSTSSQHMQGGASGPPLSPHRRSQSAQLTEVASRLRS